MCPLPEVFERSIFHSENRILDPLPKLLSCHILGPDNYSSIVNKEAGKGELLHS
jgi:hypothetical protein